MSLTQLVLTGIQASIILNVLALGLETTLEDYTSLLGRPRLLLQSLIAMNVVMPVLTVALVSLFALAPPVKVALVALALSPVPPLLPKKLQRAGATQAYGLSLLAIASVLSIVLIPVSVKLLGLYFGRAFLVPTAGIVRIVLIMVIVPLAIGLLLRRLAPALAQRIARPTKLIAPVLLAVCALPLLLAVLRNVPAMVGTGALLSLALFSLLGLAVGHFLGGSDADDRAVLAMATSARHPGIAASIAVLNFADRKAVLVVVLVHLLIAAIVTAPYNRWRKRRGTAAA